jgi:hypothetical protein
MGTQWRRAIKGVCWSLKLQRALAADLREALMWDRWARTTRFLESARLALGREGRLWDTLEVVDPKTPLTAVADGTEYRVDVAEHRAAIADDNLFYAMVLLYSYATAEGAAAEKLNSATDSLGQIEIWSQRLLEQAGAGWTSVLDGKAGIIEVAIYRNAIAHGATRFDQRHVNRFTNCGASPTWNVDDLIVLDYEKMKLFRSRLKSLLRVGQVKSSPIPRQPDGST